MLENIISEIKLEWILNHPPTHNEIVLLIPQYNELSNSNFLERLNHFNEVARTYDELMDVIIIDDGSSDNSLEAVKNFIQNNTTYFNVAAVTPNADKIGALYSTILNISYHYVIFSDFDTDLINLEFLRETSRKLEIDSSLMGCYFRMIPMRKFHSTINRYQQLEYAMQRTWYKFTSLNRTVAVMPGSCSLFKYKILKQILKNHSGIRNGEDRETTAMGLNLGYRVYYENRILALTRAPKTLTSLISQRIRWNLGYIEPFYKERNFYTKEILSLSPLGLRTAYDILNVSILILFPIAILSIGILSFSWCVSTIVFIYILKLIWILVFSLSTKELGSITKQYVSLIFYPIYKVLVDVPAWYIALYKFLVTEYNFSRKESISVDNHSKMIYEKPLGTKDNTSTNSDTRHTKEKQREGIY